MRCAQSGEQKGHRSMNLVKGTITYFLVFSVGSIVVMLGLVVVLVAILGLVLPVTPRSIEKDRLILFTLSKTIEQSIRFP